MKASELKDATIVTVFEGAKIGTVEDVLFSGERHRMCALVVKSPRYAGLQILLIEDISSVGKDAITIESADKLQDRARHPEPEDCMSLDSLKGRKVVTTTGTYVGNIEDIDVDAKTGVLRGYEVSGGTFARIFGRTHLIEASDRTRLGKEFLVVPDDLVPGHREEHHEQPHA